MACHRLASVPELEQELPHLSVDKAFQSYRATSEFRVQVGLLCVGVRSSAQLEKSPLALKDLARDEQTAEIPPESASLAPNIDRGPSGSLVIATMATSADVPGNIDATAIAPVAAATATADAQGDEPAARAFVANAGAEAAPAAVPATAPLVGTTATAAAAATQAAESVAHPDS